ncbi:hypothetical protein FNV43_RR17141 [Rhamnella rubrinervis]|uniref:Vacuolar protein sorting-associated protein 13 VPS13 adaptor binding domain-containing protein n=1 Tax=Rhamnella rubrinervis TaxID=2594499 RepID=A0A8K0GV72_9ROSA|nr:hypothetical protein FNV43_RR17141 [Rhamnella rubrinervis]
MFFDGLIQRRLAYLLQPWLREEPELEVKLGFINSHAVAKNLRFDTSVLSQLVDEDARLSFKEVTVEHLSLRFSNWSVPAFSFEVRGVHVILSVGELDERNSRRVPKSRDAVLKDMKKKLKVIDPEGSALHGYLEKIMVTVPSRKRLKTAFLNLILNQCQLQMQDINIQVQFSMLNDSCAYLLDLKKLNAESQYLSHGCLLRGIFCAPFLPLKESSYVINGNDFDVRFKREDQVKSILTSTDVSTCIKLKVLQLVDFSFRVPELSFSFSPADVSMLLAFGKVSSKESQHARSGRQLWELAASRIGQVSSAPRMTLQKAAVIVRLWLRYVNAYEFLLVLIGYSADHLLQKSASKMSQEKKFLSSVVHQWKMISVIEKELPVEHIAQARRIARYRAASNVRSSNVNELIVNPRFNFFLKFFVLLNCMWKVIYKFFHLVVFIPILFFWKIFAKEPNNECLEILCEDCDPQFCFILNVGRILVTISYTDEIQLPAIEKLESHAGIPCLDFVSFCLSFDALLLRYVEDFCEQSLIVSCGNMNVKSASFMGAPEMQSSLKKFPTSVRRHQKGSSNDLKTIMWSEPALVFPLSEPSNTNGEGACHQYLESFLGLMWLNWKRACLKFGKCEIQYSENPCFLCEMKSSLTCPGMENTNSGFWKCFLTLGKFNLALGCSSILSLSLLLRQIQHALSRNGDSGRSKIHSHSPRTIKYSPETSVECKYNSYASSLKMTLLRMLPEKHIQLGVFMAGLRINFSLGKDLNGGNKDTNHIASRENFYLACDMHNVEVAVWPASASDPASYLGPTGSDNAEPDCIRFKQPQRIDVHKSDGEKYFSQSRILLGSYFRVNGLNVYLGNSEENQQSQIFALKMITIQLSTLREYVHSFSKTVIDFSAALNGSSTGLTILAYMDEFYLIFQVLINLCSAISYVLSSFDSISTVPLEIMRQEFAIAESETIVEGPPSICNSTSILIEGTCTIKSADIILHKSRITDDVESSIKSFNALTRKKLAEPDLPDHGIWISIQQTSFNIFFLSKKKSIDISCEEGKLEIFTDISEVQCIIFRYRSQKGETTNHPLPRDWLLQSLNSLYEISLSSCRFTLSLLLPQSALSSGSLTDTSQGDKSCMDNISLTTDSESSSGQSSFVQEIRVASNILAPVLNHWLHVNVVLSLIYMGRHSVKNTLVGERDLNKLLSSLSVGGEFEEISWSIQGGLLFIETKALETFIRFFASYLHFLSNIISTVHSFDGNTEKEERDVDMTGLDIQCVKDYIQETLHTPPQAEREHKEAFILDVSQFSIVLLIEDEKGGVREFMLEVDIRLNFELANMRRKYVFDISRFSIRSQVLQESVGNGFQISQFSSVTSNDLSTIVISGDSASGLLYGNVIHPPDEPIEGPLKGSLSNNNAWVGSGSISGFDVTLSISEMKMILFTVSSFSDIFGETTRSELNKRPLSSNPESDSSVEAMVPNGSIVAIKDVHQHMYFAIDGEETKYSLVGAVHYSLVGERALFRVKYHSQRWWNSSILWFSLISLHAKNDSGEPLRLTYRPGSGFVDISSTVDSGGALWKTISCEPESYEGDIDWEPYNQSVKKTFYLVNKKNDCAVAFVDGVPEFVRKPGNPFKLKVFPDISKIHLQDNEFVGKRKTSGPDGMFPCIALSLNQISLTIVHELSDTEDVFPLLRGCIDDTQLIIQVLSTKTRVINTLRAVLYHFDSQKNSWRELLHPVEICLFYRSSFHIQGSEAVLQGVPIHIHCRTKEFNISLSELSLDILLFVIGKLNLAGPYSLKSSMVLANCCKVENRSGLNLLCNFFNKQSTKVPRNQSTTVFLRYLDTANQPPGVASVVSFQLASHGSFITSSLHLSRSSNTCLENTYSVTSRSYPGPFVVVDVSRESEEGLSIVVSPLVRIHNETGFSMELRFRRPQQKEDEFAPLTLKSGDIIDDTMTMFDAIHLSGGLKKALTSLSLGNFLLSFRPEITDGLINSKNSLSVEWSEDLKGEKAVRLSGIFDKLSYKVRKALFAKSMKCSFSTAQCTLKSEGAYVANVYFLIQSIGRDVPVVQPNKSGEELEYSNSMPALQAQKEIFLLPTVRVSNLLQSEIHVCLSETGLSSSIGFDNIGNQATISCGSTMDFYANPFIIYFTVTLIAHNSSCKPVNSGDWIKKLLKQKSDVHCLDIDLDFGGRSYFACLRLSRGHRGILEAAIFTPYALKNDTEFSLCFSAQNRKPLLRHEVENLGSAIPPELGLVLPPNSMGSWFLKSNKVRIKLLVDNACEALLDLDALSGLTEISLEIEEIFGFKSFTKLGVSTGPPLSKMVVPSQLVTLVPRYVVVNESEESIIVRQCYLQDDVTGKITINSKQKTTLMLWNGMSKRREFSLFEKLLTKHRKANDDALIHIQFCPNESEFGWSGPVCIASLGRFFLKFRKQQSELEKSTVDFATVHVVEEGSTLVLRFHRPPNIKLPYRIENCLCDVSLTFQQKDSSLLEVLGSESSIDYVWDDLTLPHKLIVQINGSHRLHEINLDKVRGWKPSNKLRQNMGLESHFPLYKRSEKQTTNFGELTGSEMVQVGYEVYADGPTRVLRFCEISKSHKRDTMFQSCEKIQLRVPLCTINLLERGKQDGNEKEPSVDTPIVAARMENVYVDSLFTDQQKYNQIKLQSLNLEQKWMGAPFAAMLRRHQLDNIESNECVLKIVLVLLSTSSDVIQIKYSSISLQPVDLNLDEETLMRVVPFWRTSLSDSDTESRQFYFDHFEIQPIKIFANFLPGESYSSYSSAQETLRSLLHSVIKVPPIKNMVVELNGVLVTHALITMCELLFRCARHYSWYTMRAIYIAKGSPLLPPDFVSIFDDLASSSLDVFFDPSRGTFKLLSKCIGGKGFSGTKRYFGDLEKSLKTAGSNVLFAAVTEISDSVLKGAEASGFNGMVSGFHHGILKLAMEPSLLGTALMEGGPDRKIKLDRSPGNDELYIEGYLQAMLDTFYRQEYLRVRVIDNEVYLKNLPPNSTLINEIIDHVKGFLVSKALLKGDPSTTSHSLRHLRGESEWRLGPTLLTLCEHLFVSFAIRMLRKQTNKFSASIKWKKDLEGDNGKAIFRAEEEQKKSGRTAGEEGNLNVMCNLLPYMNWFQGQICKPPMQQASPSINLTTHMFFILTLRILFSFTGVPSQKMAFIVSKAQPSLSEVESSVSQNHSKDGKDSVTHAGQVTSELHLRSSSKELNKDVVLRRFRHHKSLAKVRGALQSLVSCSEHAEYADSVHQHKWLDQNDYFLSP